MTKNRCVPFAILALTACQAPVSEPSAPAFELLARDYVDARAQALELGVYRDPSAVAAMDELNARVAKLTEQLAVLTQRLPSNAATVAEASVAAGPVDVAKTADGDRDAAASNALRRSLEVLIQQERISCENIANVNASGYKRRQMATSNVLDKQSGMLVAQPGAVSSIHTVGTLEITERSLDVAIDGDGFFAVVWPDGSIVYTRDGNLHLNADGKIVTGQGHVLSPEITVAGDTLQISIDPVGRVAGRTAGSPDSQTIFGQIQLHRFVNASGLRAIGANSYRLTEQSGQPITGMPSTSGLGLLKQGFLERSNVQLHSELINLQSNRRQQSALRRALADYGVFVR